MSKNIFNHAAALKSLNDDQELFKGMVQFCLEDSSEMIQQIKAAHQENELKAVEKSSYLLKGTALTIGASELAELARKIETSAREGKNHELNTIDELLDASYKRLEKAIQEFLKK